MDKEQFKRPVGRGWRVLKWLVIVYVVVAVAYGLGMYHDFGRSDWGIAAGLMWPILLPMFLWIYLHW